MSNQSDSQSYSDESYDTPEYRNSEDVRNDQRDAINNAYGNPPMFAEFSEIITHTDDTLPMITFKRGDCSIIAGYVKEDIYIYSFSCDKSGTGLGKFLLHDVLVHLKGVYPNFAYIMIDPVPQMDPSVWKTLSFEQKDVHKQAALHKLAGYYKKLGFTDEIYSDNNSFPTLVGDINTILRTIESMAKGTRKRRIRKARKQTNKKGKGRKGKKRKTRTH